MFAFRWFYQICDENMSITYVDGRHPGANHDAFIWDQSGADHFFKTNYSNGKRNTWLLGKFLKNHHYTKYKFAVNTLFMISYFKTIYYIVVHTCGICYFKFRVLYEMPC